MISDEILKKMIHVAKKSNVNQKHSCALLVNNRIITTGFNKYCNNNQFSNTIHAEIDALFNFKKLNHLKKNTIDIVIIRFSHNNLLKNSKPCHHCIDHIKKYNDKYTLSINRIYYSNEYGNIVYEKIYNMKNNHISSSFTRLHKY